uniref:SKI/SNO/DAC domain-containing protein n=1 Tax=Plectus sambesii TaxID=2011161 RepID=A0A914W3W5_9BILA
MIDPTKTTPSLFSMQQAIAALKPTIAALNAHQHHMGVSPALEFTGAPQAEAEAILIDYRGEKVAGFEIDGENLVCLPQVYELFLKSLVGGLHTVYTKLKRLDIVPRVCNVEQVRALRSLGAIQPGVNRCKLISCKDFDVLYEDCTNTSSRPGRPPKRSPPQSAEAQWHALMKKQHKLDDMKSTPTSVASCNASLMNASSAMHMAASQQLFGSLLPFTAQQLMMQQMMAAAAASNSANGAREDDQRYESSSPSLNAYHRGPTMSPLSDEPARQDPDESVPLNLTKSEHSRTNGCSQDVPSDDDLDSNDMSIKHEASPNMATDNHPGVANAPLANWAAALANAKVGGVKEDMGYASVQSLLMNVLGLVEVAAASARSQQEQVAKDRDELSHQLETARAERSKMLAELKEEQRMRKIYFKRWCKAKKAKFEVQSQLLTLLEAHHQLQKGREPSQTAAVEPAVGPTVSPTVSPVDEPAPVADPVAPSNS